MADDFDISAMKAQLSDFDKNMNAQKTMFYEAKQNDDKLGAAEAMRCMSEIQAKRDVFVAHCQQATAQPPSAPYVSQESRNARGPSEMDATDLSNLMNESRYARLGNGKAFTAQDYYNLRSGLPGYYRSRGQETK
jgi:hypothetical protein